MHPTALRKTFRPCPEGHLGFWAIVAVVRYRQVHCKCRALADAALYINLTIVFINDVVGHRQAQSGAFADLFGGEKGVEDWD